MNFVLLPFISEGKYNIPLEIQIAQQMDASYLIPFGKEDVWHNFKKVERPLTENDEV